jgi:hypothetical protein
VRITLLAIDQTTEAKLATRGITPAEVEQLRFNRSYLAPNPHPRTRDARLLIGPTDSGRLLTVVVEPDGWDAGLWHVMTAWPASRREILTYRRHA